MKPNMRKLFFFGTFQKPNITLKKSFATFHDKSNPNSRKKGI